MKLTLTIGITLLGFSLFTACAKSEPMEFIGNSAGNKPLPGSPYGYELWSASGNDNKLIWYGPKKGAAFRAEWNDAKIFLGRVGYFWNEGKPYTEYGNLFCEFEFERSANETSRGASYIGIYGWSRNPLIEWYIVEDWFGYGAIKPHQIGGGAEKKGEFTVDGSVYFVYQARRVHEPSIEGTAIFPQYFSVRQDTRQKGKISITEHFKEWEKLGMPLGTNMYEAKFLVESGSGTGWMDAKKVKFSQKKK